MLDFLSFLLKLILGLLKGIAWVLVKTGLWVPAAYSLLFLIAAGLTGTELSGVTGVYVVGLIVTTVFALLVTVTSKISAHRKKRAAATESSPSPAPKKRDKKVKLVEAPNVEAPTLNGVETVQPAPEQPTQPQYAQPQPMQPQPVQPQYGQPVQPQYGQPAQPQPTQPFFTPYLPPNPPVPAAPEAQGQGYYPQQYPQQAFSPYVAPQNISSPAPAPQPEAADGYASFGRRVEPQPEAEGTRIYGDGDYGFDRRRGFDGAFDRTGEAPVESFGSRRYGEEAPVENRFEAPPFSGRRYDGDTRENAFNRTNEVFSPHNAQPEQPRIFRTRMDPNLLIYEYSDRLDFYEITPSGPVLRSSEPKRK